MSQRRLPQGRSRLTRAHPSTGVTAGFLTAVEITDIEKRLAEIERRVAGDGE
jgi:hypothetical protein